MSPNGRFIAFTAPGDQLTDGTGTTRDGIFDTGSGNVIAAPQVSAINNDGWFASGGGHLSADAAASDTPFARVVTMSRLNDDGTISGPYAPHQPKQQASPSTPIVGLDASLSRGVYGAGLTSESPYRIDARDARVPVVANMVTGDEQSIVDTNPAPDTHPTYNNNAAISPKGRYVAFTTLIRGSYDTKLWDTTTGQFWSDASGYFPLVADTGQIVADGGGFLRVTNVRNGTRADIHPFDPAPTTDKLVQFGFATDSNRVLTCTEMRFSRFDTNDVRDCYLVPLPAQAR